MAKTKSSVDTIDTQLAVIRSSGSFTTGYKQAKKDMQSKKSKLVLIASNCPRTETSDIEYRCLLSNTKLLHYNGTSVDLGNSMGKQWPAYCVSINDLGESSLDARIG